jgi:hypothetical protein
MRRARTELNTRTRVWPADLNKSVYSSNAAIGLSKSSAKSAQKLSAFAPVSFGPVGKRRKRHRSGMFRCPGAFEPFCIFDCAILTSLVENSERKKPMRKRRECPNRNLTINRTTLTSIGSKAGIRIEVTDLRSPIDDV